MLIEDIAINNPPQNNIFLLPLKLWIKNLGSPINKSKPIDPRNIKNKFISAN